MSPNWFQAHIQKVLSEGVQLNFVLFFACFCIFVCLVDEGERVQILLQAGHYRPASETPFM